MELGEVSVLEAVVVSIIALTNIALAVLALARAHDKKLGNSLGLLTGTVTIWIVSAFLSELTNQIAFKILLSKIAYISAGFGLIALINLLNLMQGSKKLSSAFYIIVYLLPMMLISTIGLFSEAFIKGINIEQEGFTIVFSWLAVPFTTHVGLSFSTVGYLLVTGYKKSQGRQRRAYQLLMIGIAFYAFSNVVANVILPVLTGNQEYYRYGNYSVVVFTVLTAYAIIAHNLFEIRTVAAGILALIINIMLISQVFFSDTAIELILKVVISGVVALGSYSLINNIEIEISRRHELEKLAKERSEALKQLEQRNRNLAVLQKISRVVLNEIELKPMLQKILDEIPQQLESTVGGMLCQAKNGQLRGYAVSTTPFSKKIMDMIGTSELESISDPIEKGFNRTHDTFFSRDIAESDNLTDFVSPPIPRSVAITMQRLLGIKHIVALPLMSGDEPLGVLMLTYKIPKVQFESRDLEMARSIADDITLAIQRAEAYEKLKDANEYLNELDKMKNEFISMASHELNTPLAAVEGYLSMILDEHMGKVDDKAKEYLGRAYASSKRLAEMILDLLNVSRIEQGRLKMKFSKSNLFDLSKSVVEELQVKADAKKLRLELATKKSDALVTWCDPDRIREVIVNLIGNAIKYTEKGGIKVRVEKTEAAVAVKVIDTGRGIAQSDMKKLFQKFSQVNRSDDEHQGTGLGLYISKNFVELHNGKIWVDSEPGKGSTFTFELPILTEPPKEIKGAILENTSLNSPKIELGPRETPAIIAESSKRPA